ncbi:GH1 family beta-glucosidase [Fulvivirgaceae bacterium BMA10]|uniref:Beta-glucosidase n=1 Tax=Splendidivirga corallicola TaxID=3051826 RepID=A0ABT8KX15_9BACT|nr:GH1 family beta-glucosidase [Fulvivirgaceae bacterium BMA10]
MSEIIKQPEKLTREFFGHNFEWGVASAAYQIEGAYQEDGKGTSIWDKFSNKKGTIYQNQNGNIACDFYHRASEDIGLMQSMNIPNFRFSLAWSRILPNGVGRINSKGVDFYDRLIDNCLEAGIVPWTTLYHWDLPQVLEDKGGWTNRDILPWFQEYTEICAKQFGDRIKHWMVLNEPMVFAGAGYFLGVHAPGRKGIKQFLPAVHHTALCQAEGGRLLKSLLPDAEVGTTFSCSYIEPFRSNERDEKAAAKIDALLNRLFIEPALGLGYPTKEIKTLERLEKYYREGDEDRLIFDFDFIGVQNYTRELVKHAYFVPFVNARLIKAAKRNVKTTLMGWEVYPESIYHMLKKFGSYEGVKKIYITESGVAFEDILKDGSVKDHDRRRYLQDHLEQIAKAQKEGINVQGFFIWTFTDNFEWAEGYYPRFGIVHIDFETQKRTIKDSGIWYKEFLVN